jgi:hypothetical protein
MRKGHVKDLYPQTFELIHEKINETEEAIKTLLLRSDEEEHYTREEVKGVEQLISELVDYWLCFDVDFPKENIQCNNQDQIIEDYIWLEHLVLEIEDVCDALVELKSKVSMYTLYNWVREIKKILDA